MPQRLVVVEHPVPATGGSAVHTLDRLKAAGARRLSLVCLNGDPIRDSAVSFSDDGRIGQSDARKSWRATR
jgi:hypothetical protein